MAIGEDTRQRDLHAVPFQGAPTENEPIAPSDPTHAQDLASHPASDTVEGHAVAGNDGQGNYGETSSGARVVLSDRHWPGRSFDTVDRIVVGPTGIFVIDVVGWSGPVELTPDVLEVNGRSRQIAVTSAHETAREVALLLAPDLRDHVYPVICLSRDEDISGWVKAVRICSSTTMDKLIDSRDVVLSVDEVAQVSSDLDAALMSNQPSPAERSRASDLDAEASDVAADHQAVTPIGWHRTTVGRITLGIVGCVIGATSALVGVHLTTLDSSDEVPDQQHQPVGHGATD
jgi:hypothetical protein